MENYYNLGIEEIEKELNTSEEGLSDKDMVGGVSASVFKVL